jgi:hypothetical protein
LDQFGKDRTGEFMKGILEPARSPDDIGQRRGKSVDAFDFDLLQGLE